MASSATQSIVLPAIVDLDALDAIRDALLDAIESGPVTVIADKVERVSTNGLFMMMSAARTAASNANEFAIAQPSPALSAAIDRLGLGARFEGLIQR